MQKYISYFPNGFSMFCYWFLTWLHCGQRMRLTEVLGNVLRLALWPSPWSPFINGLCVWKEGVFLFICWQQCPTGGHRTTLLILPFKSFLSSLTVKNDFTYQLLKGIKMSCMISIFLAILPSFASHILHKQNVIGYVKVQNGDTFLVNETFHIVI